MTDDITALYDETCHYIADMARELGLMAARCGAHRLSMLLGVVVDQAEHFSRVPDLGPMFGPAGAAHEGPGPMPLG